ncbi:MAG: thioredoxin [Spirochaetaceae bacterium]|jgi:thioredoxin 1|nr:thioredoxin [Spirochaetaceae bacterium]
MAEIELTAESFQKDVLDQEKPVLVDFWAEWCVPCRMLTPIVEELAEELEGKAIVAKGNVDEIPEWAEKYGIQSIPTLMVFHKGEVVKSQVGAGSKESIEAMLEGLI